MKIPETANIGAYYGNEDNGQWQPNGVIIDSGVGGGVVGSGDAGIHRPQVYPVHMPRTHIPAGYVMAGYYPQPYPAANAPDDFADYMWMENEEEFDKQVGVVENQVMQQLEEEALMEQCIEAMLEDEQRERRRPTANGHNHHYPTTSSNGGGTLSLEETVSRSTLNPLAAEFVPTRARQPTAHTEVKQESPPQIIEVQKEREESAVQEVKSEVLEESKTEEPAANPEPPEVSAADVQPRREKKMEKKPEVKKTVKVDPKKLKPQAVKSDTKLQVKKKEVKTVKSEMKIEEREEVTVETEKPQSLPAEEPVLTGPKPINYAAAAKANKPKKPTTPPAIEKSTPPPLKAEKKQIDKTEKKKVEKAAVKPEKPIQRKNSAK